MATCEERFLSDDYLELFMDFSLEPEVVARLGNYTDYCIVRLDDEVGIVSIPKSLLSPVNLSGFGYQFLPMLYSLAADVQAAQAGSFDPTPLIDAGILPLHREPLSLQGNGVVLAFPDTGIAYDNPVFRNPDGTSRILAIWDQTIQDGTPPEGFPFGSEYTREDINRALASENPREIVPSYDTNGHGTAIASVAAGSSIGNGTIFTGAAPMADIVVVKLKEAKNYLKDFYLTADQVPLYSSTDIMLALKYINSFAVSFTRPVVTCLGFGSGLGDHTDQDIFSLYLQRIAGSRGKAVVTGCGLSGASAHHYSQSLHTYGENARGNGIMDGRSDEGRNDYAEVEFQVESVQRGFVMELWGDVPNVFSVSIRTPGGEQTAVLDYRAGRRQEYSFIYDKTRITVEYVFTEQGVGDNLIFLRFQDPTPGVWTLRVIGEQLYTDGYFNIWLPQSEMIGGDVYFLKPDPYITLTEPSPTENAISVTTYDSANGSIYFRTGRGYTRDGQIKPDLAAPGVNLSAVTGMLEGNPVVGRLTGSSMSAAISAGGSALLMQWAVVEDHAPYVRGLDIKNYLIQGADRDSSLFYPNRQWGYGTLNVNGVFTELAGL